MIMIVKNNLDPTKAKQTLELAHEMAADIVLIQNAAYLAQNEMIDNYSGIIFALTEDLRLRGISDIRKNVRTIDYEELVDLMDKSEKVVGAL